MPILKSALIISAKSKVVFLSKKSVEEVVAPVAPAVEKVLLTLALVISKSLHSDKAILDNTELSS